MKSLFAKILLWFWCALVVTIVGSAFISALNVNQNDDEGSPIARLVTFQLVEARTAYEEEAYALLPAPTSSTPPPLSAGLFANFWERRLKP